MTTDTEKRLAEIRERAEKAIKSGWNIEEAKRCVAANDMSVKHARTQIIAAMFGSCDCESKLPDRATHADHCRYLKLTATLSSLDCIAPADAPSLLLVEIDCLTTEIDRLTAERDAALEKLSEVQDMIGDEIKLMHRHKFCQNQSMCLPVDHFTDMLSTLERIRAL